MSFFTFKKNSHIIISFFSNKNRVIAFLCVSFFSVFLFSILTQNETSNSIRGDNLILSGGQPEGLAVFKQWEAKHNVQGKANSFSVIEYEKCIPIDQCKFNDCNVQGSRDNKGNFCLPVKFSNIGDWAPDMDLSIMGISLVKNPDFYSDPVEHTQASARLPDANNNAYFMFSNSQNYFGFIWVVEVQGIDPEKPEYLTSDMPARVVWWQKLNKCHSERQCKDQFNPGNFNHPARISREGSTLAIAFQNYSYTLKGELDLAKVSDFFKDASIPVPKSLETSTLPVYPKIRSADAIAFYDVSNPKKPRFVRKLVGDNADLWGGNPPGRDISEVAFVKVGDYYHMNVGGTIYNYNGKGKNKGFRTNYRMRSPYTAKNVFPMMGNINADIFANVNEAGHSYPVSVRLNSVPYYYQFQNKFTYGFTLQLITRQLRYNDNSFYTLNEDIQSTFLEKKSIFSARILYGEATDLSEQSQNRIISNIQWQSEACNRAWGFQVLDNGAYNVICHDMNPMRKGSSSKGRFIVRGVSVDKKTVTRQRL